MLRFRDYDVFHATTVFPMGFFALCIGKYILRKPVVVTFYGTDVLTSEGKWYTKWAKDFTLRHASAAIAISRSTRDRTASKYGLKADSLPIIYTPLEFTMNVTDTADTAGLRVRHGLAIDDFIVLFVGNLVKRKGAELLVQALHLIDDSKVKLVIVGDGPERKRIENHVALLGLEDRVRLVGRVADVDPYYRAASVFSMPSFFERGTDDIEGLGIVYLEAQAAGVPVVGTRSGGIPEAVAEDRTGFLVDEQDVSGLARRIIELHTNLELRLRFGEEGKKFVREAFGVEKAVHNHVNLYRRLASGQ